MVTATLFCLHSRLQHLEQHLAQAGAQETPAERTKWASQVALAVKNPTANAGDLWVGKTHWRRKWQPIPVFLLGKSLGQRSLEGYSPQGGL